MRDDLSLLWDALPSQVHATILYLHQHWPQLLLFASFQLALSFRLICRSKSKIGAFAWGLVLVYGIHLFEEYGVDFLGVPHAAFKSANLKLARSGLFEKCNQLKNVDECQVMSEEFVLWTNFFGIYASFLFAAVQSAKDFSFPLACSATYAVFHAGWSHIFPVVTAALENYKVSQVLPSFQQVYKTGVVSAVLLTLPAGILTLSHLFSAKRLGTLQFLFAIFYAVGVHAWAIYAYYLEQFGYLSVAGVKGTFVLAFGLPVVISKLYEFATGSCCCCCAPRTKPTTAAATTTAANAPKTKNTTATASSSSAASKESDEPAHKKNKQQKKKGGQKQE